MITFRDDLPISATMDFEQVYHPNLRMEIADKQHLRNLPGAIFLWMHVYGTLAGETYGIPLSASDSKLPGLEALPPDQASAAFYCYSNTLLPNFHRQGLGPVMKSQWLTRVANAGFKYVYGHARPGASQKLNSSFGAVYSQQFPNWYGTGETYALYRLALNK